MEAAQPSDASSPANPGGRSSPAALSSPARELAAPSRKIGRPSKFEPAFCDDAIDYLASGHSVTAFAGHLGVARSTVFKWAAENERFSDALKVGQAKATAFWEDKLVDVASGEDGNATAIIFGLKNRAPDDWADKVQTEVTGKNGGPIETKDLSALEAGRRVAFLFAQALVAAPAAEMPQNAPKQLPESE